MKCFLIRLGLDQRCYAFTKNKNKQLLSESCSRFSIDQVVANVNEMDVLIFGVKVSKKEIEYDLFSIGSEKAP